MKRVLKMSNSSFERYECTTFQLSPLHEAYKYDLSFEAIDCCTCAVDILQRVYNKAELIIQNCEFSQIFLYVRYIIKNLEQISIH